MVSATKKPTRKSAAKKTSNSTKSGKHKTKSVAKKARTSKRRPALTAQERYEMIAAAAFIRAERRNFQDGDPIQDWLDAEKEIDRSLMTP